MVEIITKEDLRQFKEELLVDLQAIMKDTNKLQKQVLKSGEVMSILKCSESKLTSLRKSGKLKCSKLAGTYYYQMEDVMGLLQ